MGIERLANGYAQSKYVAEQLVRESAARGLPVTIHRPGRIAGDATHGAMNVTDSMPLLIKLCIELGTAPTLGSRVEVTPVDFVARSIVAMALAPWSPGQTFHLVNPETIAVGDVYRAIRAAGYGLQEASFADWRARVIEHAARSDNLLLSAFAHMLQAAPSEMFQDQQSDSTPQLRIQCTDTTRALERASVRCPETDQAMVLRYLGFLQRKGAVAPPADAPESASSPTDGQQSTSQAPAASPPHGARSSLVPLRKEDRGTPLFCIPGLGGHVAAFMPLARALTPPRSVFALQARGLDGEAQPQDSLEDIAAFYTREICQVEPEGPYLLLGWSLGGLVAIEIARRLQKQERQVAFLALLDTYLTTHDPNVTEVDDHSVLKWIAPHLGLSLDELRKAPLDQRWQRIAEQAKSAKGIGIHEIRRLAEVCRAQLAAAARYEPQPYHGDAVLLHARNGNAEQDPRWKTMCPQLRIEPVPGDHFSMLREGNVEILAERLKTHLR
jgi:thioesterase domain-containing protein